MDQIGFWEAVYKTALRQGYDHVSARDKADQTVEDLLELLAIWEGP